MTYTIWKNGGKHEWILRRDETIIARSGLIFNSYSAASRAMRKYLKGMGVPA